MLFDLSPNIIENLALFQKKKEEEKLVATVMVAAKEYQPSIIYLDDVEKLWPAKKKGRKTKKSAKKKVDAIADFRRIKKPLGKWRTKFIDDKTRITIIGCTSEPEEGSKKEFRKFFDR